MKNEARRDSQKRSLNVPFQGWIVGKLNPALKQLSTSSDECLQRRGWKCRVNYIFSIYLDKYYSNDKDFQLLLL